MALKFSINWDDFPSFQVNDNSILQIIQEIFNDYNKSDLATNSSPFGQYIRDLELFSNEVYFVYSDGSAPSLLNVPLSGSSFVLANPPIGLYYHHSSFYGGLHPLPADSIKNVGQRNSAMFDDNIQYYFLNDSNIGYNSRFYPTTLTEDFKNNHYLTSFENEILYYNNGAGVETSITEPYVPLMPPREQVSPLTGDYSTCVMRGRCVYCENNSDGTDFRLTEYSEFLFNPIALLTQMSEIATITNNGLWLLNRFNKTPYRMVAILPDGDNVRINNNAWLDYGASSDTHYCTLLAVEKDFVKKVFNTFHQPFTINNIGEAINTPVENLTNYEPIDTSDVQPSDDGAGNYNSFSDEIDFPSLPNLNIFSSGMFTAYRLTDVLLGDVADFLWSDDFLDVVSKLFSDPADTIISLSSIPISPPAYQNSNIKFGNVTSEISAPVIANQFQIFDFGELNINHYFGNYADYEGYSDIQIYLPFIGIKTININDVMNSRIHLKYYIDIYSGDTIAFIKVKNMNVKSVLYTFTGNILSHLPISSTNYSNLIINGLKSLYLMGSNPAVGALSALNSNMSITPKIESSYNNGGVMSMTRPYIILRRQIIKKNNNQPLYDNATQTGLQTGLNIFDRILNIDTSNMTDSEYDEIEKLLKNGVVYK